LIIESLNGFSVDFFVVCNSTIPGGYSLVVFDSWTYVTQTLSSNFQTKQGRISLTLFRAKAPDPINDPVGLSMEKEIDGRLQQTNSNPPNMKHSMRATLTNVCTEMK